MDIKNNKYHFIAIGGVGMSALAKYLAQKGAIVTGSDATESKYTKVLEKLGVRISIGHDENLIKEDMIIVTSSAIKEDNVELKRAKKLNLKIYHRSDILKLISDDFIRNKNGIFFGFAGTHGKTTTSGMCSYVLSKGDLKPSYIVGGFIPEIDTNGEYDGNKYFCAELDESDGTIKKYTTTFAIINNLEEDHLDYYKNGFADIVKTFNEFLSNNPTQTVIINNDDKGNNKFIKKYPNYKYITFGLNVADYTAKNIKFIGLGSKFDVYHCDKKLDTIELSVLGKHNIYNALAVYVALKEANVETKELINHFKTFSGMGRRFQKVCSFDNIDIYDDYAHHPSEIQTTINSVKNAVQNRNRVVAIFQPHRYSRLKGLWEEFKNSFDKSDLLIVLDVFSAGEEEIKNVNSEIFSKEIKHKEVKYIQGDIETASKKIYPLLNRNDIVITLGAGTITKIGSLIEKNYKG